MRLNSGIFAHPLEKVYSTDSNPLIALYRSFASQRFCIFGETLERLYRLKSSLHKEFSLRALRTGERLIALRFSYAALRYPHQSGGDGCNP